ncbi:MAG TPA: CbiX/SirB N-terminal domain-containing protein [Terriglobia bacterium]|nr:CbiX/SirB N-terminal domain-containing protein [Terriglobia bacterium]
MAEPDAGTGILLFAHGSSVEEANGGVRELARQVQQTGNLPYVRAAFLEIGRPDLTAAVDEAVQAGFQRILVIPFFLTVGIHLRRDLPDLLARQKQRFPGLEIHVGESLEGHPSMPALILDRIRAAEEESSKAPR